MIVPSVIGPIQTELTSFALNGGPVGVPLGSDPDNTLPDSVDGFMFVDSTVSIIESLSEQSLGEAWLYPQGGAGPASVATAAPPGTVEVNDGDPIWVDSFFDVYFDVTFTDVDPRAGRDYATGTPTITIEGLGPANMRLGGGEGAICTADTSQPNFGCLPPVGDAYIGHFDIVVDLSAVFGTFVDINQNGTADVLKFTLATHNVGDVTATWIDGQTQFDTFNSNLDLDGAILDETADPPFSVSLSGPTMGAQEIVYAGPANQAPAPATLLLLASGIGLLGLRRRACG